MGRYYDPELDFKRKIEEMHAEWEANAAWKHAEKMGEDDEAFEDGLYSGSVSTYFEGTSQRAGVGGREKSGLEDGGWSPGRALK